MKAIDTSRLTRGRLECKILRMEFPLLFWVRLKNGESALQDLSKELNFRMNRKSKELICCFNDIEEDKPVAIKDGDVWQRGLITGVNPAQRTARIDLRDIGRQVWRSFHQIFRLERRFQELCWQALTCGLAYTGLAKPTRFWSRKIRALCRILTEGRSGYINIVRPLENGAAMVKLVLPHKDDWGVTNLRDALVSLGEARVEKEARIVDTFPAI
ncbi:hypothetical protein P5V15_002572 [Pogonomyrmex californicus]